MCWYQFPEYSSKEIGTINRISFWQDNYDDNAMHRSIHSIYCGKICCHKCKGGLGIRIMEDINAAFLAKQG